MNETFKTKNTLKNKSSEGFIILGAALAIFLILSLFSIYLLRIVVNENIMSSFALLDIRTRNLSHSGLEHGIQLFKDNGSPYISPIEKNFNDGSYVITFETSSNQDGTNLPYAHFTMLKSVATINDVIRNTRVFLSSYQDAFNLAYYSNSANFTQSGTTINGDIYSNGNLSNITISGIAYTTSGTGGTLHPEPSPELPSYNSSYFQTIISEVPIDSSGSEEEESFEGWPVAFSNCNKTGADGPSQTDCNNYYSGTDLDGDVTVSSGMQIWTVPTSGTYYFEVSGAQGGSQNSSYYGGYGAKITGQINLNAGQQLLISIGQKGSDDGDSPGGGGGTVVALGNSYTSAEPLFVAGGGGGRSQNGSANYSAINGQSGTSGGNSSGAGNAGTNGNGASYQGHGSNSGGGAGFFTGSGSSTGTGSHARGFRQGYRGSTLAGPYGGFGGGGAGSNSNGDWDKAGGGGYSGGNHAYDAGQGGGGGSFYATTISNPTIYGGSSAPNIGHGIVRIGPPGSFTNTGGGSSSTVQLSNCNKTGADGPSQTDCNNYYSGTDLDGDVTVSSGMQIWTVPTSGTYYFEVSGAQGGSQNSSYYGGYGAKITGQINLNAGQQLLISIGQKGSDDGDSPGGGGGTVVALGNSYTSAEPLFVAGGGGGRSQNGSANYSAINGQSGTSGGNSSGAGNAGTNGNGASYQGHGSNSGGGAGFFTGSGSSTGTGSHARGFRQGYRGSTLAGPYGGFGGGGAGSNSNGDWDKAGGGGYSGGNHAYDAGQGGGGGSFYATTISNPTIYGGSSAPNIGHGIVHITLPSEESEESEEPPSYTETGIINLSGNTNTYGATVTFDGATVNGPGKIVSSNNIIFTNSSIVSGDVEIISGGEILIENSSLGTTVEDLINSVIIYGATGLKLDNGTVYGLSIIADGETLLSSSNYYGALYNEASEFGITSSLLTGSVVSSSGINVINSTITKGSLPPVYGTPYGFEGMVVRGSYLEY